MERRYHTAWTPTSLPGSIVLLGGGYDSAASLTAESVPGVKLEKGNILILLHINTGGGSFELKHSGWHACGIPEAGDTMVLTGGVTQYNGHNYVTRWVDVKIIIMWTTIVMMIMILTMIMKMNIVTVYID